MPIPKTARPPAPPKSTAPGKNIPRSEERLKTRDFSEEAKLKTSETEKSQEEIDSEEGDEKEEGKGKDDDESENENENEEEDNEEDESQIEIAKSIQTSSNLLSPEGVIFLPLAILLDLIGIILLFFGLDDFGVLDIVGGSTIGIWAFTKTGATSENAEQKIKKAEKALEKAEKVAVKAGKYGRWLRPALCFLGEIIPYIGWLPFWTYLVYKTLTDNT